MRGSRITGMGHYLPDRVVTNDDLAQIIDTSSEWIIQRTGIEERRWVEGDVGLRTLPLRPRRVRWKRPASPRLTST